MKKIKMLFILSFVGIFTASCSSSANKSTTTHVKDLVQSDVFSVLPEGSEDVLVYENANEIEGEYLELATVNIKEISEESSADNIIAQLKKEAKELGGNGILFVHNSTKDNGKEFIQEMEVIAVFAFDLIPSEEHLVNL